MKFINAVTVLVFCFLMLSARTGKGQCNIIADTVGCLNEPVSFSFTPANASIVKWEFGDGTSGAQKAPVHKYANTGFHTVRVTLRLADNSTCTAEHDVNIHAPPVPDMVIGPESEYCLSINRLCLIDSAKNGLTNTQIAKRAILWGDGAYNLKVNPVTGENTCYSYQRVDTFKVTIEWTNRVGCSALQEFEIKIKQDYIPSFTHISTTSDCGKTTFCFENDSIDKISTILKYHWDFGYGYTDTPSWNNSCFTYDTSGNYTVRLRTLLKNGCVNESRRKISVFIPEFKFNVQTGAAFKCYPASFNFKQEEIPGMEYTWFLLDTGHHIIDSIETGNVVTITPHGPGKYLVMLKLKSGDCEAREIVDTITTFGVLPDFRLLNSMQCVNLDTVFACNKTLKYGTDSVLYLWNFGDRDIDTKCTTDLYQGTNTGMNCNWVYGEDAKHKYKDDGCYKIRLIAWDLENGCVDSTNGTVIIHKPDTADFFYSVERKCVGTEPEYRFTFDKSECLGDVLINYDSACNKDFFAPFGPYHNYASTCDTSGWVTVGFIVSIGSPKVYRSCDTSDYYFDTSRICSDTFWKSHWFRLSKPPDAKFKVQIEDCLPTKAITTPFNPVQPNVVQMRWDWGDGTKDTLMVDGKKDSLATGIHYYLDAGEYNLKLYVETDSGCFDKADLDVTSGYFNDFLMDTIICPGQVIQLNDFVRYWNDPRPFWRDTSRANKGLETLIWDIDDGNGFSITGPLPRIKYVKEGRYRIRMASKDMNGCTDTAEHWLTVTGVVADIVDKDKELVCNDIIQFLDSSWMPGNYDSIAMWNWDFGDGKTPSYLQDPYHYYSSYGDFTIRLIVKTFAGCTDTAFYPITIDGPEPYFEIISDTVGCVPFTAHFQNLSVGVSDFIWYFGDDQQNTLSTKSDTNVSFTYTKPGIYYIFLWGSDSVINEDNNNGIYYCNALFPDTSARNPAIRRVIVLPVPEVDFITDSIVCASNPLELIDRSDSIYDLFRWYISNGDSVISATRKAEYQFNDTGMYTIWYKPRYTPEGPYERSCFDSDSIQVRVYDQYVNFTYSKDPDCPRYTFSNNSKDVKSALWDFGTNTSGDRFTTENPVTYNFARDSGDHTICLYVTDKHGCMDTVCEDLAINYRFSVFIPNIFTPEGDKLNDEYDIDILNEGLYDLKIYNRWGELVFNQSGDADAGSGLNWDGTFSNSGDNCPEGTYFYIFRFINRCYGKEKKVEGTITLIR